jgi:cytoplasmic iron level regulating protein YaaA (DUF328/UPF0246 family)
MALNIFHVEIRASLHEQLKVFQEDGYEFAERLSSAQDWVFVR